MPNAAFVYDDALSRHVLRSDHPMRPVRLRHTYELLSAYGAFDGDTSRLINPRSATEEELEWVHTPEYIAAVRALSAGMSTVRPERFGFSSLGDNPVYPGMYDAATLSSGATLVAAELVAGKRVDVAFSISGGLHHAAPTHAYGFCIFNDPAIAIKYFPGAGDCGWPTWTWTLITATACRMSSTMTSRVLTISIHESGRYLFPGTGFVADSGAGDGIGYSINVPLFPYTEDEPYLWAFREVVPPLIRAFAPDVLVTQLGIDSYHTDPITHLQLTSRGYVEIIREFAALGLPWLALGGGGYDIGAVARCWTLAYGVMLDTEWPDRIPDAVAHQYPSPTLRDTVVPDVPANYRQEGRRYLEDGVAELKRNVLARHGLG